jgi:hypothetical protein
MYIIKNIYINNSIIANRAHLLARGRVNEPLDGVPQHHEDH